MRLKHGAFRHLRMAAKGAALGTRHLLKPVDENFTLKKAGENFEMALRNFQTQEPLLYYYIIAPSFNG